MTNNSINKAEILQSENGMYHGTIYWNDGDISAIVARTSNEVLEFFSERDVTNNQIIMVNK